jgi:osmoprotectant transport system ATP-binding protein
VTDADDRPLGWADLAVWGGDIKALEPYGQSFEVGRDSLRVALDRAVLAPAGQAVAVDGTGRALGIAGQETVAAAIRAARQRRAADSPQGPSDSPQGPSQLKAAK